MSFIPDSFKGIQALSTTHSAAQATSSLANTFVTITGSEISYTPTPGSTKVIYEINFYAEKIGGVAFIVGQLENADSGNSNWAEINAKFRKNFGYSGSTSQSYRWNINWKFVLPAWTGEKQLRLRIGHTSINNNISLHQITNWDGAGSVTDRFCNTNLEVYSI